MFGPLFIDQEFQYGNNKALNQAQSLFDHGALMRAYEATPSAPQVQSVEISHYVIIAFKMKMIPSIPFY